jgi:transcriptional regulator with XRE-family HTH domain
MMRLKQLRSRMKISQAEMGDYFGVSQSTYSRYEHALEIPFDMYLKCIAIEWMLDREMESIPKAKRKKGAHNEFTK